MKKVLTVSFSLFFLAALTSFPASAAPTSAAEEFYKGKTIRVLVGFSPGNNTDVMARIIARHLAKQTNAAVIVQNNAGGGGLVARNEMYTTVKPDGLTVMFDPTGALWPSWILEQQGVLYDISKFEYLGGVDNAMMGLMVSAKSPYKTVTDLRNAKTQLKFGASGVASLPCVAVLFAIDALGLNAMVAPGYKSAQDYSTAIAQGELDAGSAGLETTLRYQKDGMVRVISYLWYQRDKHFPDVPSLGDAVKIPEKPLNLMKALSNNGKLFFAPPNTPADKVQYLRDSLKAVFADKDLQADIVKLNQYWPDVFTGEELKKLAVQSSQGKGDSVAYYKSLVDKYVK